MDCDLYYKVEKDGFSNYFGIKFLTKEPKYMLRLTVQLDSLGPDAIVTKEIFEENVKETMEIQIRDTETVSTTTAILLMQKQNLNRNPFVKVSYNKE
jgi:hypothetical protein